MLDACITKAIAGVCCPTGGSSEAIDLYLDGKIEHWYSLQGKPGVAFIINVTDPTVAHEMHEKLSVHSREAWVRNGAPFEVVR